MSLAQQTREVGPTLVYGWANVVDGGPTVSQRPMFAGYRDRGKKIIELKLCYKCLKEKRIAAECRAPD